MATKTKKRSRGLRGTPKMHAKRADQELADSVNYSHDAVKHAKAGACGRAFEKYGMALKTFNQGVQDLRDAGHGGPDEHPALAFRSATLAFRSNCLVGGGLSGVKRRRK